MVMVKQWFKINLNCVHALAYIHVLCVFAFWNRLTAFCIALYAWVHYSVVNAFFFGILS